MDEYTTISRFMEEGVEVEVIREPIPFKIFSGLLKASRDPDGKMRLRGVASSTVKDRHGDTMAETAIRDMERAANENLTIFLNHSYNVPEDVAGSVERATMIERGYDGDNNPIWDLDFDVVVNDANPRAVDAFNAIDKGTKLGLSIGAMIPEGGAVRNKKTGTYLFNHVDLLETSIVGIPANPRSWVQNAVKALKSAQTVPLGTPSITLDDDGNYEIKGKLDGGSVRLTTSDGVNMGIENTEDADPHQDDPDEDVADEPTETPGDGEPEVQDAKIQVITIDTDDGSDAGSDGSQGASESDPDTEPGDDVYDSVEPTDASHLETLMQSLDTLESAATAIIELQRQRDLAFEERDAARRERDEVAQMAYQIIEATSQTIDKLASMPVGRKAVLREVKDELSGLERLYGPSIVKLLRSDNNNG